MTKKPFNINRYRGEAKQTRTAQNKLVNRQDRLFVPEYESFVACAPYDDHFVYENPDKSEGTPAYLCTCGSVAVIAPPGPQGLFVCHFHATYNQHQTSVLNKDEFEEHIGGTKRVKTPKRWI